MNDPGPRQVALYDTTLREGGQAPEVNLDAQAKVRLARALVATGADAIEAGYPMTSPGEFEAVHAVAGEVGGSVIVAALARANRIDVTRANAALAGAARPRITVFVQVSEVQARAAGLTLDQMAQRARESVARARDLVADVQLSLGDVPRAQPGFVAELARAAAEAGAGTISLVDSAGVATPEEIGRAVSGVREALAGLPAGVSVHCHDDLGLATANAFAGVLAGADQVECSVNGVGERAGNTALEEIAVLLRVKGPAHGVDCAVRPAELASASAIVEQATGYSVSWNKAVVGRHAFVHSAGVHQDAVLADDSSYGALGSVFGAAPGLALGKHTSLAGLRAALVASGASPTTRELADAYRRLKELADAGRSPLTLADLLPAAESGRSGR